jgi:16S rRNA G527 N7-methylase RsmG
MIYAPPVHVRLPMSRHPTLGFYLKEDDERRRIFLHGCQEGTEANRLKRWKSQIRHAVLRAINGRAVHSIKDVKDYLTELRTSRCQYVDFVFAKVEHRTQNDTDAPQMHFDQLRHINQLHIAIRSQTGQPADETFLHLTRSQLKKRDDYNLW